MPSGLDLSGVERPLHLTTRDLPGVQHAMYRLVAPIKNYAWGSTTLLADLTGTESTTDPQAEMWFGTHPTTPTALADGGTLADLVDLPFLVKLLAAAQPLSLQAHPTIPQARAGFAAENAAGLALDHPQRTYRDANHKPEMIVALTEFTAMAGFRDPVESAQTFRTLADLVSDDKLAATLATLADQLADGLIHEVFSQLVDTASAFWQPHGWTRMIFTAVQKADLDDVYLANAFDAATIHPDDPGALVTLLMNLVHLSPGEALFISDGTIHAYVAGLGLEIMATSDNVIRGGLTIKHVDLDELDRVVSYSPGPAPFLEPRVEHATGVTSQHFSPPVTDFALSRYDIEPGHQLTLTPKTPHIAVCSSGTGQLISDGAATALAPGAGTYLPGHGRRLDISADTTGVTVFLAYQP